MSYDYDEEDDAVTKRIVIASCVATVFGAFLFAMLIYSAIAGSV